LKVQHFEFNDNYGWIRDGKGGKDRLFVLAKKLKGEILAWISFNRLASHDWLFPGQGRHMSTSTIQLIIKKATQQARLNKRVSPHTLRHSFATHLIENGYAVTEVQPLLGHNSVNTTMIYLHMASPNLLKVQSPYDALTEKSGRVGQGTS
jgi:integrase/recombinase XerD